MSLSIEWYAIKSFPKRHEAKSGEYLLEVWYREESDMEHAGAWVWNVIHQPTGRVLGGQTPDEELALERAQVGLHQMRQLDGQPPAN